MITASMFVYYSGNGIAGNLQGIVDALNNYHRGTPADRISNLYIVFKETEHWLQKHKNPFFETPSHTKKLMAVVRVQHEVYDALNLESSNLGSALQNYGTRKASVGASKNVATLGKGYRFERTTYLATSKQQAPFSASVIHEKGHDGARPLNKMTEAEFEAAGQKAAVRMYFVNKIQRMKLIAQYTNAGWTDINDQLRSSPKTDAKWGLGNETDCQVYVMDRYGNLFVDNDNLQHARWVLKKGGNLAREARKDRGQTNHSSLCAGRDVICAGTIYFWKGQLVHIDNSSGHYGPKRNLLRRAIEILVDQGTNPDYLRVQVWNDGFYSGRGIMHNLSKPDWPDQNFPDASLSTHDHIYAQRGVTL